MQFKLMMPMRAVKHYPAWIEHGHLTDVAQLAEQAGFAGVGMTDHPFPADSWLARGGHHSFDPFVALSFMAAATSRVKLITSVLVSGYRNPYLTAKSLASLDLLSGGRVVAGMAAGYLQPEFEVLGADWGRRGLLFDAAIDAMRAAWTGESVDRGGDYAAHGHTQLPRPFGPNGPPLWIGGNSGAARRRAAQRGDGWMPIGQPEAMAKITKTPALETIGTLTDLVAGVQRERAELGKEPLEVCFAPFGERSDMRVWSEQVHRDLAAYEDAGVTWLTVEPPSRSFSELQEAISIVGERLM